LAILHDPEIIILDEPTAGLDVNSRQLLYAKIDELKKEGKTILLTSHDMFEVENLCDRVLFIEKGRIGRELSEESLAEGDRHIVAVSSEKNSLVGADLIYSAFKEEIDGELFFECGSINLCLRELLERLEAEDDRITNIYIKKKTVEEELTKLMRGDGHENS